MSLPPPRSSENILAWGQPSGIHPLPWACFSGSAWPIPTPAWTAVLANWAQSSGVTYHIFDLGDVPNHFISATGIWDPPGQPGPQQPCSCSMRPAGPGTVSLAPVIEGRDQDHADDRQETMPSIQPACSHPLAPPWAAAHPAQRKEAGRVGQPGRRGLLR